MLTIEIHGMDDEERAKRIRAKIMVVLEGLSYTENYRIGICHDDVTGDWVARRGFHSWVPFFRVFFDPEDDKDLILRALWPFLIDIHWLVLEEAVLNDRIANPDNYREVAAAPKYEDT